MRYVGSWNDLVRYGIIPLTGESCGLMYRILFDVTEQGRRIIGACLGIPDIRLAEPWNGGCEADPHVGSLLLAPEMFVPVSIFALLESGCSEVWLYESGAVRGIEPTDTAEQIDAMRRITGSAVRRTFACRGTAGDRNIHQMSGRIA